MRVMCIAKKEWVFSRAICPDPAYGDICTVVRQFECFGYEVYQLEEFPHPGGYDVKGFMPLSDIDESARLEAWQTERLTQADKMLQALAENMPEVEMPKESFERVWNNVKKTL